MISEKEAIIQRHSVRSYEDRKIEPEKVQLINEKIRELNEAGSLHIQFIEDAGKTYSMIMSRAMGLGSAPSVIACAGQDVDDLDERVGYYGQKLVLYLQQLGLNTCWTGMFNKKNTGAVIRPGERLAIAIAVGYGKDQGKQRKSRNAGQVICGSADRPEWFMNGVEAALHAPTAMNQQKFMIQLNDDGTVDFIDKGGAYSRIDLGIVRCNFEIGADRTDPD